MKTIAILILFILVVEGAREGRPTRRRVILELRDMYQDLNEIRASLDYVGLDWTMETHIQNLQREINAMIEAIKDQQYANDVWEWEAATKRPLIKT
jgi:hypothetical protein